MSLDPVIDFAEIVKKFFYYRASLCDQLNPKALDSLTLPQMNPDNYHPLTSLYIESVILACAAIDGLSSIWEELTKNSGASNMGNKDRFTSFLLQLPLRYMDRVCTAFLYHFLGMPNNAQPRIVERPFRDEVFARYVEKGPNPDNDPTFDDLKSLYDQIKQAQVNPIPQNETVTDIEKTLDQFRYVNLIYNFYRNPFMHAYRGSRFTTGFSRESEFSVRQFDDTPNPQMDIAIGVFTNAIRAGADKMFDLIQAKGVTELPDSARSIRIRTN